MKNEKRIKIVSDFSEMPYGRHEGHGPDNGEKFRRILAEALRTHEKVIVDFDDLVLIPGSSFLDEAFGGLIRDESFSKKELDKKLEIVNSSKLTKQDIATEIEDAVDEKD